MAKKAINKTISKTKFFSEIKKDTKPESCFGFVNGTRISNLKQLAMEIDKMPDEVFYYHLNDYKNDYANWIRDVLGLTELADKLADIKNKSELQVYILKYIVKRI